MLDDFTSDIEDEIAKSLEKLAEEETNVAKSYVDKDSIVDNSKKENRVNAKTQAIPVLSKSNISGEIEDDDLLLDYGEDFFKPQPQVQKDSTSNYSTKPLKKDNSNDLKGKKKKADALKLKLIIAAICVGVVLVIGIIIAVANINNNKKKETYQYNYEKGMECFKEKRYKDAIVYLEKAAKSDEGKKNVELKYDLYVCYNSQNDYEKSVDILKDILSYDSKNKDAIAALVLLYDVNGKYDYLNDLVHLYRNTEFEEYIKPYIVSDPVATPEAGDYDDTLEVKFISENGELIYYSTDGTVPDVNSTLFDGEAIVLETGTTTFKVVAVNDKGIYSEVMEFTYVLDYKAPDAPVVSPASGTYSQGQKISIDNIPEGCKAYYTLDGKTPTEASTEYTGEFDMPTGNTIVSVIIINSHQQSSSVTKRNYVVSAAKTYSYDESLNLLKNKLINNGVIKSDGKTTADGSTLTFVYLSKTNVNDVEMYVIRYDITRNGVTSTGGYYGVAVKTGKTYVVSNNGGSYSATEY